MGFSINTNVSALNAYNALSKVNAQTEKAQLRLATQKKINSVADDTSGYNVGKKLEAQTLKQKSQLNNISSAKTYLSTAESALQQINDKLNAIAAKQNDLKDPLKDSTALGQDIKTLANEISSILKSTDINGTQLLASATDGSSPVTAPVYEVGGTSLTFDFASVDLGSAALATAATALTTTAATPIDTVTTAVRTALGKVGNLQQALESRGEFLTAAIANNTATISNIFDADMAMEQLNATKGQIGSQIATAILAQVNSAPQQLLALFR